MSEHRTATDEQIESFLAARGYSGFHIRPPWYRSYRLLGIRVPIPATMNFQEHLFYNGIWSLAFFAVAFGVAVEVGFLSGFPRAVLVVFPILMPIINWLQYRKSRREIRVHLTGNLEG